MFSRRQIGRSLAAAALIGGLGFSAAAAPADDDDAPANVFISPCGKPFRAKPTDPYPVAAWFKEADKNGDGKLDRTEFVADAETFFKALDVNGDGVIDPREVSRYERGIAPEILGYTVKVSARTGPGGLYGGRIWKAQMDKPGAIDPGGGEPPEARPPHDIDESAQGASPYGFFFEPEPVMAADENLNGYIRKAGFLRLAGRHFDRLDPDGVGYLTLAKLPKTQAQLKVERYQRHGHRS
ncbi:MAG: EF-hand domain-containing protein [Caulobacteraceae bacterium]|nr:EF-hand domain-containing protein [Caulobacteraceae bacterium]